MSDFLEELNECTERVFGVNAQQMKHSLLFAKLPARIKRSINLANLQNGTSDQIVAHLERDLDHSGLENDGELSLATLTAAAPNGNSQKQQSKTVWLYCKKTLSLH